MNNLRLLDGIIDLIKVYYLIPENHMQGTVSQTIKRKERSGHGCLHYRIKLGLTTNIGAGWSLRCRVWWVMDGPLHHD